MNTNENAVKAVMDQWVEALERKDTAAMMQHYAPDATLYDCKPPYVLKGIEAIKQVWDACLPFFPKAFKIKHHDLQVQAGEDMALLTGLVHTDVPEDPEHPACGTWLRVSTVYRKQAGEWKIVHEHVSVPFNPMTDVVAKITDPEDVMCGVSYEGCVPPEQK